MTSRDLTCHTCQEIERETEKPGVTAKTRPQFLDAHWPRELTYLFIEFQHAVIGPFPCQACSRRYKVVRDPLEQVGGCIFSVGLSLKEIPL